MLPNEILAIKRIKSPTPIIETGQDLRLKFMNACLGIGE
jgi:hypothetical protein